MDVPLVCDVSGEVILADAHGTDADFAVDWNDSEISRGWTNPEFTVDWVDTESIADRTVLEFAVDWTDSEFRSDWTEAEFLGVQIDPESDAEWPDTESSLNGCHCRSAETMSDAFADLWRNSKTNNNKAINNKTGGNNR